MISFRTSVTYKILHCNPFCFKPPGLLPLGLQSFPVACSLTKYQQKKHLMRRFMVLHRLPIVPVMLIAWSLSAKMIFFKTSPAFLFACFFSNYHHKSCHCVTMAIAHMGYIPYKAPSIWPIDHPAIFINIRDPGGLALGAACA